MVQKKTQRKSWKSFALSYPSAAQKTLRCLIAGRRKCTAQKLCSTARTCFRQSLILYARKYGVTKAAIRYGTNWQYIYCWRKRYNGTLQSLMDRSHRPHSHPNQHGPDEIKLIHDMRRRNPNAGLAVFWVKLRQRGYTRSIAGLYRFVKKAGKWQ